MPKKKSQAKKKPPPQPTERAAFSIEEFCAAHSISPDLFYKMQREKWGPKIMRVGARTLISIEAAEEWRRNREAEEHVG
jgi:hypothetical protein